MVGVELLVIEQRRGNGNAALWVREGARRLPGRDSNERLTQLHAGLGRHAGVREVVADAGDEAVEGALDSLHERALPGGADGDRARASRSSSPSSPRPGWSRHPGPRRPRRRCPRGHADGDHRRRADAGRRPLHLRGLPPARPPRRPRLPGRLLLPEERRGRRPAPSARAAARRSACSTRSPLPEWDLGPGRADGRGDAALAARGAGHQPAAGGGAAADAARTRRRLRGHPRRRHLRGRGRRIGRGRWPPRRRRWSSRSATTPSQATRTAAGASGRRSSARSVRCSPTAAGRSASSRRAATRWGRSPSAATPSPSGCSREGRDERRGPGGVSRSPRRDRRRDRPPARRALPDLPRSRRLQERARDPDDAAGPGARRCAPATSSAAPKTTCRPTSSANSSTC